MIVKSKKHRLEQLNSRLKLEQQSTIEDLARHFGVSTATIRRDIKELDKDGAVIQTIGGEFSSSPSTPVH